MVQVQAVQVQVAYTGHWSAINRLLAMSTKTHKRVGKRVSKKRRQKQYQALGSQSLSVADFEKHLVCKLSGQLLVEPVVGADGFTYNNVNSNHHHDYNHDRRHARHERHKYYRDMCRNKHNHHNLRDVVNNLVVAKLVRMVGLAKQTTGFLDACELFDCLTCPVTGEYFVDAVITPDGITYNDSAITANQPSQPGQPNRPNRPNRLVQNLADQYNQMFCKFFANHADCANHANNLANQANQPNQPNQPNQAKQANQPNLTNQANLTNQTNALSTQDLDAASCVARIVVSACQHDDAEKAKLARTLLGMAGLAVSWFPICQANSYDNTFLLKVINQINQHTSQ